MFIHHAMRRVAYVHSTSLQHLSDRGTHPPGRSSLVHELIHQNDLLEDGVVKALSPQNRAVVIDSQTASRDDLLKYHTRDFVGEVDKLGSKLGISHILDWLQIPYSNGAALKLKQASTVKTKQRRARRPNAASWGTAIPRYTA